MFKRLKEFNAARSQFDKLTASGTDPYEAAERITSDAVSRGLDPEMIAAIMSFLMMLIELFVKK